jgi:pilus assembly protein Flp/PilA
MFRPEGWVTTGLHRKACSGAVGRECSSGLLSRDRDTSQGGVVEVLRAIHMRTILALSTLKRREEGQALVEYALLVSLIAVVSIAVLTALGHNVSSIFSKIEHSL